MRDARIPDPFLIPGEKEFVPAAGAMRENDGWLPSIMLGKLVDAANHRAGQRRTPR
ncbi:hypothetical protein [Umezawaea sp. Da 62-37]|uniref:hypothetical protein n=1 Tax=Umezawaea sp. Da 62-37 TaxID=3075927 RepID=UPI0028F6E4B1|nr:hypothetical protein [Umezawaea sp. Da 62-37]WNV85618.1 hypothetical protein RM788_47130 [Umezawaea sp. Da 62-37]